IVLSNFSHAEAYQFSLKLDPETITAWELAPGNYTLTDQLGERRNYHLQVNETGAQLAVALAPLQSLILALD
ncbi:MAG: hypothetical protein ACK5JD_12790, partial [Mangrovibacterium sp.]